MKNSYLQRSNPSFSFWKWVGFGSLFLLMLNYISSLTNSISISLAGIFLGYAIMVRITRMQNLSSTLKILYALGLSLLISLIATSALWGYCFTHTTQDLCEINHLHANTFGNFSFPLISFSGWIVGEIYKVIKGTASYLFRINKTKYINRHR